MPKLNCIFYVKTETRLKINPKAMTGEQLYKIMKTQEEKYGVKYLFCDKEETGKLILELLGVKGVA